MLVCVPQSVVYHVGGATLKKENPRKTFLNFRNNLLMLYKNLPEEELAPVMRVRAVLDYVAALTFLLKGQWANARAVWQARKEFRQMRAAYAEIRRKNRDNTVVPFIAERASYSLLLRFYLFRRCLFSEL